MVHLALPHTMKPHEQPVSSATFAALDLGTNNCRLLMGTPAGDGFRVIDSFSRIVRLGEGLQATGVLSDAAMERAMAALHACAARLSRRPVRAVRAIATEACRRAGNGAAFLARVRTETGLSFNVISPREEAELALESCMKLLTGPGRRALLFDIGGGSTELAWVRLPGIGASGLPELIGYASLPVGVVTLAEQFGHCGFDAEGFQDMVDDVRDRLGPFERIHCIGQEIRQGGVRLLGTSGTVTTLAGVALNLQRYRRPLVDGISLDRMATDAALALLRGLGREGLSRHPCVGSDRMDFVLPGCAIFEAIRGLWPIAEVTVADRGPARGHAAAHDAGGSTLAVKKGPGAGTTNNARGLSVMLRTSRGHSPAQQRWLSRQLNDPYVAAARQQGLRSRAAFKLMELDDRFHLITKGCRVLDLGAAPGGWSQIAVQRGARQVVGVDLLPVEPVSGAKLIQGDFEDPDMPEKLIALMGGPADLVLSDMAPNTTGHAGTDHIRIMGLAELALDFATRILAPGGGFVAKVFQGGTEQTMLVPMKQRFTTVKHAKPPASRKESSELYVVAQGFKA